MAAATSVHVVAIVEPIIQHADWFFPEGELWLSFRHHRLDTQAVIQNQNQNQIPPQIGVG